MSLLGKPIEDVIETLYKSIKSKRQIITDIKKEYNIDNDSFNDIKINRFKLIDLLDEFEVTISQSLQAIQTFKVEIFNLKEKQTTEEILNLTNEFQMKYNSIIIIFWINLNAVKLKILIMSQKMKKIIILLMIKITDQIINI